MVVTITYAIYTLLGSLFLTSESLGLTQRIPHNSITDVIIAICVAVFEGVRPRVVIASEERLVTGASPADECPLPTSVACSTR